MSFRQVRSNIFLDFINIKFLVGVDFETVSKNFPLERECNPKHFNRVILKRTYIERLPPIISIGYKKSRIN